MSDLKLKGKITKVLEVQKGTSKQGNEWQKIGFIVTTGGDYSNDTYFTVFGEEKVKKFMEYNKVDQDVEVSFNISTREYNGRYYTDLAAWRVFTLETITKEEPVASTQDDSDLPF